jgi:hypothetical protein
VVSFRSSSLRQIRNRQSACMKNRQTEQAKAGKCREVDVAQPASGRVRAGIHQDGQPATIEARRIFREVADAARELTMDAINTLAAIMKNPKAPAAARISAAQALLDRGYGKPAQAVEVNAQHDLSHVSDEDLETVERILRPPGFPPPPLLRGGGVLPEEGDL